MKNIHDVSQAQLILRYSKKLERLCCSLMKFAGFTGSSGKWNIQNFQYIQRIQNYFSFKINGCTGGSTMMAGWSVRESKSVDETRLPFFVRLTMTGRRV